MRRLYQFFVYVMSNEWRTIYVGVTNDLVRRVIEHRNKVVQGFTARYDINRLVYFEEYENVHEAIAREKQIKGWKRFKEVALIESTNPEWKDLAAAW